MTAAEGLDGKAMATAEGLDGKAMAAAEMIDGRAMAECREADGKAMSVYGETDGKAMSVYGEMDGKTIATYGETDGKTMAVYGETDENPICRHSVSNPDGSKLEYLTFPLLEKTGIVRHLFSTRLGGVSRGIYASMNLSFSRGDREEDVLENYRRIAAVLGCGIGDMTASHQTHTTNIRRVTSADKGKGITAKRDYEDVDGLITDEAGIVLVTYYADCVPLYFVDPVRRAIGLAHSGWRGTADRMGECMVRAMGESFGSRPEDLAAVIAPSICRDCYEVGEDVAEHFRREEGVVLPGKVPGKYQLDLWRANAGILEQAGIPRGQIAVAGFCTCHNSEYLFSHRASGGKRGNLGAFLMLEPHTV